MNITDKDFFKSRMGKMIAKKYFGYTYDDPKKKPKPRPRLVNRMPVLIPKETKPAVFNPQPGISPEPYIHDVPDNPPVQFDSPPLMTTDAQISNLARAVQSTQAVTSNTLTLVDIVRHFKYKEVVGEENLACAITLAAINGSSFGVEGFSGSGKTFIVDKLIPLLPDVYKIQQSSETAIFNDTDRINQSRYIYIPELQKAMKRPSAPIIEVIKDLTEGKDSNRIVTKRNGEGVQEYTIKSGVTIIYTLALENRYKKDEESSRRLIRFTTDSSKQHLEDIHSYKAKRRQSIRPSQEQITKQEEMIKAHIQECINMDSVVVVDPFAEYISALVPKTQKSVGYIDHYYALLDGCTKFHCNERISVNVGGQTILLTNLEDHYFVFEMYFNDFIDTLHELATEDEKETRFGLIQKPYWKECLQTGLHVLKTSPTLAELRQECPFAVDEWYSRQVSGDRIMTTDYRTGLPVEIANLSTTALVRVGNAGP